MRVARSLLLLLCSAGALALPALPTQTSALPAQTPSPAPEPTQAIELRAAAPSFTGVHISLKSISKFSYSHSSISLDLPSSTCTQSIKPDKNGYVPPGSCGALWNYYPSFGAAILFSVLFGGVMIAHLAQGILYKAGYCWVVLMAAIWEFGSYASRVAGSRMQQNVTIATISQILVLLAPIWVNAFDYMVFARMVHYYAPSRKVWKISPSILAFMFVSLDIVSFIIQLIGGGMASPSNSPEAQKKGLNIYMGGIGMQEGFIVLFLGLIIFFHRDMLHADKTGVLAGDKARWRPMLYTLYGSLIAITVRIIFRLAEFSGGFKLSNPLPHHESYFYVFEAIPMLSAILLWNVIHPGRFLVGPDRKLPTSWLSRKLCCCCHRNKDDRGGHRRLNNDPASEELKGLRARDVSQDRGRNESREGPFSDRYGVSRDTSPLPMPPPEEDAPPYQPYTAYNRDASPYRQHEFLGPPR